MMARRGVQLTYETVREWCDKFGPYFAEELRRRNKGKLGSKWHLDEVFLKIKGVQYYLWRAVDQNGAVIDISCNRNVTGLRWSASFGNCFAVLGANRGSLSPTNFGVMVPPNGSCSRRSLTGKAAI